MERERLTHEMMKNHLLSGDKIDSTTRGDQEDFELDRLVGNPPIRWSNFPRKSARFKKHRFKKQRM